MTEGTERAAVASLAHGLAHEVAALTVARQLLLDNSAADAFAAICRMIDARKDRVAQLGAEVSGHA